MKDNQEIDKRYLLSHPESDCLVEVFTWKEAKLYLDNQCDDVTDIEEWERIFKENNESH